jgi:hypothetical protein
VKVEHLLVLCGCVCVAFAVLTYVAEHYRFLSNTGWGQGNYFVLTTAVLGCIFTLLGLTSIARQRLRG